MKKMRNIIILITAILLIILIVLLILSSKTNNEPAQQYQDDEIYDDSEVLSDEIISDLLERETAKYKYIYVNEIMDKFFGYIKDKNATAIMSLLDTEYIQENNLINNNILNFFAEYESVNSYFTKEIYTQEINYMQDSLGEYEYIRGIIRKEGKEYYIYILLTNDFSNATYNLKILDNKQFNETVKNNNLNQNINISIPVNEYNVMENSGAPQEKIASSYFEDYINAIKNSPEYAYNLLNEEYRTKRFGDVGNYVEYINEREAELINATVEKYAVYNQDGYTQYICLDNNGNYYIFNETVPMEYSVILDSYTIDIPQFLERYNTSNTQTKIALNINKFINGINDKNYNYSYSVLADSFKQNQFPTINDFENYAKTNFYEVNEVQYISLTQQGSNYVYNIILKDKNSNNQKNMTIVMKLGEETDFEMSFSIN